MDLKKTILYQNHVDLSANMVEFGGFLMPLYYTSIADEHLSVRNQVGMFDVSHMGEIRIRGKDALKFVNYLLTSRITVGTKMMYGLLCMEDGNVVDDLMVYPYHENDIFLVVNASNTDKDFEWIQSHSKSFDVEIINESDLIGEIAVQGPLSESVIQQLGLNYPTHSQDYLRGTYKGEEILISRSGYTGEDGFEVYGSHHLIQVLWNDLLNLHVKPCGLGCRDTLRFEAAMPLYEHEISDTINPLEAGLKFAVDFTKNDFIGKKALERYAQNPKRKLVGIELLERNVARAHYPVYKGDKEIGFITTGYLSPSVQKPIAMALIDINEANLGNEVDVIIRNKPIKAVVRSRKFYNKKNKL